MSSIWYLSPQFKGENYYIRYMVYNQIKLTGFGEMFRK